MNFLRKKLDGKTITKINKRQKKHSFKNPLPVPQVLKQVVNLSCFTLKRGKLYMNSSCEYFQAIHVGPIKWVFLFELDLVKEAYKRDEINYRWRTEFVHKVSKPIVTFLLS